jgi:hypothetical protein
MNCSYTLRLGSALMTDTVDQKGKMRSVCNSIKNTFYYCAKKQERMV